ncbi:hypothetical protein [Spongiactinospora sp. TRM90649]|uniref:hypothetical protein n=1 Tax=Spongiactinospora sp. TRM90649 TaxID=3031114 RepID=UPI0023F71DBD|nr:hypothetical protein [Spongiactinospora sp. TRM90649]MDF5756066.1 hypothetical protein [Spongiactinospora sp. TRM90649]
MRAVSRRAPAVALWGLLASLCIAFFAVTVNGSPAPAPIGRLEADLRAGAVETLVVSGVWPAYGDLVWSTGPTSWWRVFGEPEPEVWRPETSGLDDARLDAVRAGYFGPLVAAAEAGGRPFRVADEAAGRPGPDSNGRLAQELGARGSLPGEAAQGAAGGAVRPVEVVERAPGGSWATAELWRLWPPLAPFGTAAAGVTLMLMLFAPGGPPHATRWAWLWLFLSGYGMPLYVAALLARLPRSARPLDGRQGFVLAFLAVVPTLLL